MAVVDKMWYKELEDPDTFYMKVTALKLLDHLTEFCVGLHTVDAVDIPQIMKSLYKDLEGVPQFINKMEATQRKSKRSKLVIHDEYLHAVALKSLLQLGKYETETREWSKLLEDKKTGRIGRQRFAQRMSQRGYQKRHEKDNKSLSEVWHFLGLRLSGTNHHNKKRHQKCHIK